MRKKENGAIIVEATIALSTFVFAIFMLLNIADISYVQSKMAVAINSASKEMSQYSYIYSVLNMDKYMSGTGGKSSEFIGSFEEVLSTVSNGTAVLSSDISEMFSALANASSNDSLSEYAKDVVGSMLAKKLVQKNLKSYKSDTADNFLRRCHVKDGLSGLNFLYTSFLTNAEQDEIDLVVTYKVRVIKLLNIEYYFTFLQRGTTKAWGKGVSKIEPAEGSSSNIWDSGDLSRGKSIIAKEKKNYRYTSDKNGFHAYDEANNEFVRIVSLDTYEDTYQKNPDAIKQVIRSAYSNMESKVSRLDTNITVKDSSGKTVTKQSNKSTRKYRVVLVVPDDADMSVVTTATKTIEKEQGIKVETKTGYGNSRNEEPVANKKEK